MTKMNMRIVLMIMMISVLLITPVTAKEVTSIVDDKGLLYVQGIGILGTLHTPYGWITVNDEDYNNIEVNDTIRYDTHKDLFWDWYWSVEVIK